MAAYRRYGFDERKIRRFEAEGRGQGDGRTYKPWLTVRDVPSSGRLNRPWCPKTGRVHHLLSDLETFAFHELWFDESVIDIREQFPLPRSATLAIAASLGIRHPVDRRSRVALVQTTDLLATTLVDGTIRLEAWAVKSIDRLDDERTLEKLDIERTYWRDRGVPWGIRTDTDLRTPYTRNLLWLLEGQDEINPALAGRLRVCEAHLGRMIVRERVLRLKDVCARFDGIEGLEPGTGLWLARRMLAERRLRTDLARPGLQDARCSAFSFHETPGPGLDRLAVPGGDQGAAARSANHPASLTGRSRP